MKSPKESYKQRQNNEKTQQKDRTVLSNYEQDSLKNQQYQMTSIQLQFIDKKVNKFNQNQTFGPKKHPNKSIEILDNDANPIHKFNYNKINQKHNRTKQIPTTFAHKYLKIKNKLSQNNSDKPLEKNLVKVYDRTIEIKDKTVDLKDKINQLIYSIASSKNLDKLEKQKRQKLKRQWKSFIRQKDPKSNQQEKQTHPKLLKESNQHQNHLQFSRSSPKVEKSSKSPFKASKKTLQRQNTTSNQSDFQIKRYDKFYVKIQKKNQSKIENKQERFGIYQEINKIYIQKQELRQQDQTSQTIDVNKEKQTNPSIRKISSEIKGQQEDQKKRFLIQVTPLYKNNQNIQNSQFRTKSQNENNRFKVPTPRKTTIKNQTSYNYKPQTSFKKRNQKERTFTNNFNKKSSINMSKSVMVQKIINLRKSFNDKYKKAQKSSSPSQSKRFIDLINTQKNIISVINSQNVIQNGQIVMPSISYGQRRLSFQQIFQQEKLKYQLLNKLVFEQKNSQNNMSLLVEFYKNNRQLCRLNQIQLKTFLPYSINQNQKQNSFIDQTFNNRCYSSLKILNSNELNQNNAANQQAEQEIQFKQGCYQLGSLQQNNNIYQRSSIYRKTLLNSFNQKKIERQARKTQNCSHITTYNFDQIKKNKNQRPEIKQLRHKYLYRNNNVQYTPRVRKKFSKEECHKYGISIVSVHQKNTSSLKKLKQQYINISHEDNYFSQNYNKTPEIKQQSNLKVKLNFCKLNNIISQSQLHQNGKPMLNFRSHTTPHQFSPWQNQQEVPLKNFNIQQFE